MRTIGTAGHVDHGKSTLVQALTGINPDRLKEEIDRKMTIDLGFAWMTLDDGEEVGIVDVPGHRDFIENMLAGVGAIDAVLFVIAADEGIMPQTREHLAILDLLEIPSGIIVLTKVDLVEEEWLDLVCEEVRDLLSTTSLQGAPILPVSVMDGSGLADLKEQLSRVLRASPGRLDRGRPRVSIDRVFSLTGFGTVVTGTLIGGSLAEGQDVEILPRGLKARIRNLQSHRNQREHVGPGSRVALNLGGINKADLARGDTVVLPDQWRPARAVDARFRMLEHLSGPLKHNQEVKLYHGATQSMARVRIIGQHEILPGQEAWVQLILPEGIVAEREDHFILRRPSPGTTLGGGQIADPHPPSRYRMKDRAPIERLEKMLHGDLGDLVYEFINAGGPISVSDVRRDVEMADAESEIKRLHASGLIVYLGGGELKSESHLMTASAWDRAMHQATSILQTYHDKYPLRFGMPVQEFRVRMNLDPKWAGPFIEKAVEQSRLNHVDNLISNPSHKPKLTKQQQVGVEKLLRQFEKQPYNTPSRKEILQVLDEEQLHYLLSVKELVALNNDVFLSGTVFARSLEILREAFRERETLTVAEVRDLFNTSRKYALALMEFLDAEGITIREGDFRRLSS